MGSGVVTVGRKSYAVGLYWENSPSGRVMAAAKEAATQPGQQADFIAIRAGQKDGRVPQFGLAQAAAGHKAGMPAFAGCLANQQPGSWAGAFRLREGVAITVVRDDLIVPDGDQLFADEAEARERILQEISFGGLQRVYAPESWAIPGSDNMPISLLMDERRDVKLQAVKTPKSVYFIAGGIVILLVGGLGIGLYLQDQEAKRQALEAERMSALERARNAANQLNFGQSQPVYPPPERRWEEKPSPMNVIGACQEGLLKVPSTVAGWRLTDLKCDGVMLTFSWARDKGFSKPPDDWTISDNATAATSVVLLSKQTPRGHEELVSPNEITRRYLAQNWPGTLVHAQDDPLPQAPPDYKGQWNPPPAPWVKRSFTLTVPELPSSLPVFFDKLPGIVIMNVSYKPSPILTNGTWAIEGVIYENRV